MKTKKHRFTHPDPENENKTAKPAETKKDKKGKELDHTSRELKNSTIMISVFALLIIFFYVVNLRSNLIQLMADFVKSLI
jgi:flagellar biosynthesis protein FlhB